MYNEDLLLKYFPSTSTTTLGTSDTQSKNKEDLEEYIGYNATLGTATFEWDWETRQWKPIPKRQVRLEIKDYEKHLVGNWAYNSGFNPDIYDRPSIFHVGQNRDSVQGNCYKYHCNCTSWDECSKNEVERQRCEGHIRKHAEKRRRGRPKQ